MTPDVLCTRIAEFEQSLGGEDQTAVAERKVDAVLVYDAPDVVQPLQHALHGFSKQLVSARFALDEGTLGIASELVHDAVHLFLFRLDIEDRNAVGAFLCPGCRCEDLPGYVLGNEVEQTDELLPCETALRVGW